jgi:hypothetical protein
MVCFTPEAVVTWEDALLPGGSSGYPVDSGMGCFLDALALEQLASSSGSKGGSSTRTLLRRLMSATAHDERWDNLVIDPATGANVISFESGYGDGWYTSYWGLDRKGEVCCLVTDFGVLVEE